MIVDILRDLLSLSILLQKSSEDSSYTHPANLRRHYCVSGSLLLTHSVVYTESFDSLGSLASRSGVHMDLSLHDESIVIEFSNVFSYLIKFLG